MISTHVDGWWALAQPATAPPPADPILEALKELQESLGNLADDLTAIADTLGAGKP